jgi:hypothetical protein
MIKRRIRKNIFNADQLVVVEVFVSTSPVLNEGAEGMIFCRSSVRRCSLESS